MHAMQASLKDSGAGCCSTVRCALEKDYYEIHGRRETVRYGEKVNRGLTRMNTD